MAVPPIILIADDGVHWFRSVADLAEDLESPDVNNGIYAAFDSTGLILELQCSPNKRQSRLFTSTDVHSVTVRDGTVNDAPALKAALLDHIAGLHKVTLSNDASLSSIIDRLTRLQMADYESPSSGKNQVLAGPLLVWFGSLIFCFEYLAHAWPSGLYFILVPTGLVLTIIGAARYATWTPMAWAAAAAVPPILALAAYGIRI